MSVTDEDREKAFRILMPRETTPGMGYADLTDAAQAECDRIAAALAAEREKARAPFLKVAATLEREVHDLTERGAKAMDVGMASGRAVAAEMIRRAAEES